MTRANEQKKQEHNIQSAYYSLDIQQDVHEQRLDTRTHLQRA